MASAATEVGNHPFISVPLFSKQPIMKPEISVQDLLFGLDQVRVEAVLRVVQAPS